MPTNIFDKTYTSSKTPLNKAGLSNSPKPYIEVNPFKDSPEFGSMIVRFEWDSFIESLTKRFNTKSNYEIKQFLFGHFSNLNKRVGAQYLETDFVNTYLNKEVNKNLLSVRVNLGDRIGSSSASIVLANFNYEWIIQTKIPGLEFLFGETIFQESLYLTIDAKGRYNPNKYYRIFTGSVVTTTYVDNPVDRKVTIECTDLSKLLKFSRFDVHPAFLQSDFTAVQGKATVSASTIRKMGGVEIARTVIPSIVNDAPTILTDTYPVNNFKKEMWKHVNKKEKFYRSVPLQSGKNMFGDIDVPIFNYHYSYTITAASYNTDFNNYNPQTVIYGDENLNKTALTVYEQMFNVSALRVSEFKSRADILTEIASLTFFTTYLDGSGNIHFHPYRFDNILDIKNINEDIDPMLAINDAIPPDSYFSHKGVYIKDLEHPNLYKLNFDEIISESYTQSEEDIITNLKVHGEVDFGLYSAVRKIDPNYYRVNLAWLDGLKMYGYRERKITTPAFGNNLKAIIFFTIAAFIRIFLERKKASFSMPLTPELQVDRPYFVPYKQMMYHIRSITHSYSAGGERSSGEYTTTINCFGGRPANMMSMIHTNLFRTADYTEILKIFKQNKFELMFQAGEHITKS